MGSDDLKRVCKRVVVVSVRSDVQGRDEVPVRCRAGLSMVPFLEPCSIRRYLGCLSCEDKSPHEKTPPYHLYLFALH